MLQLQHPTQKVLLVHLLPHSISQKVCHGVEWSTLTYICMHQGFRLVQRRMAAMWC